MIANEKKKESKYADLKHSINLKMLMMRNVQFAPNDEVSKLKKFYQTD